MYFFLPLTVLDVFVKEFVGVVVTVHCTILEDDVYLFVMLVSQGSVKVLQAEPVALC